MEAICNSLNTHMAIMGAYYPVSVYDDGGRARIFVAGVNVAAKRRYGQRLTDVEAIGEAILAQWLAVGGVPSCGRNIDQDRKNAAIIAALNA